MPEAGYAVRVASWNIHRCVGSDRRRDVRRVAEVILALEPDVIALQEVETPTALTSASSSFRLLGELAECGYRALLGPTMLAECHSYGNVLLSRLPIHQSARVDLTYKGREPRGLIDIRVQVGQRLSSDGKQPSMLRCMATHLGLGGGERRAQIARIASRISPSLDAAPCRDSPCMDAMVSGATIPDATQCDPIVLIGDFNEVRRRSRRLAPINQRLRQVPTGATFPARWPLLALDRIWYRGGRLEQCETVRTDLTRMASDHLPLLADIRVGVH
jgi:endonuclease/exonuclease/phosphatase family metal-dependent hydrolase